MKHKLKPAPAWYRHEATGVIQRMQSQQSGLTTEEAQKRLSELGPNRLPPRRRKNLLLRFLAHFNNVPTAVLLAAAALTGIMAYWIDTAAILTVALINALFGFMQESNAEKSSIGVASMLPLRAQVRRNGNRQLINASDLVPGDMVLLRTGDRVPADIRLTQANNLHVEEAILTGKSAAVAKQTAAREAELMPGERDNMVFAGTLISSGSTTGIVVATGEKTELGKIHHMMADITPLRTPLQVQTDKLGGAIALLILTLVTLLFCFSLLHKMPLAELTLTLAGLALAAVPEGLSAIVFIILSLGVQTMAKKKALIRKLPTVETLGAMTVICSDKTGTLTMNEMTVKAIMLEENIRVEGNSYRPEGRFLRAEDHSEVDPASHPVLSRFLYNVDLCNDSKLLKDDRGRWVITGEPTTGALKVLAAKASLPAQNVQLVDKIPFDSAWKYEATHHVINGVGQLLVTGAPDVLLKLCDFQLTANGIVPLDAAYWQQQMSSYAQEGLCMIASAYRLTHKNQPALSHSCLQNGLIFCGIAAMMDPPRPEAVAAIADCHRAGIRVKMITGDRQETAMAIGRMLGIGDGRNALTGYQLEQMNEAELAEAACRYDIFAHTSPEHKLRLVDALQSQGEVVGMTGDGTNDAPALKQADVGIAMGIKGTEVTREAADMVLTDDNFATLASAVKEGRRLWDNLKKIILFVMSGCLAQALLFIVAILMGRLIPLTPLQILWINVAASATLSFGLAFEKADPQVMNRQPRETGRHVMDGWTLWRTGFIGALIALSAFLLEAWLQARGYSAAFIHTVLLQMVVTAQWVYMLNCRDNERFSLNAGLLQNRSIGLVSAVLLLLQLAIINLPLMNTLFGTVPLPLRYWLLTLAIGVLLFVIVEIEKPLTRRWRKT